MADPVLVLAWLALAHLGADFVLQTNRMATDKFGTGRKAWRGLLAHVAGVGVALVPVAAAFGEPGLAVLVTVTASHLVIDRSKVILTRRAEARALQSAHRAHEAPAPAESLGTAWTPVPAALFAADQAAHVAVFVAAWAIWLSGAAVTTEFAAALAGLVPAGWDPGQLHRVVLTGVVLAALAIVNIRAGALFVATLVHPRQVVTGSDAPAAASARGADPADQRLGWTVRLGPFVARADPTRPAVSVQAAAPAAGVAASPAQIGATIGILERLLIVTFVMTGAHVAIGLVVAAKTLARFRQLDDRAFAEYYLLGTLASVAVAIGSALIGAAALAP